MILAWASPFKQAWSNDVHHVGPMAILTVGVNDLSGIREGLKKWPLMSQVVRLAKVRLV